MVLATHAIVGATVASTFTTNPVYAFLVAFVSHFLLDSIPHWDYQLLSLKRDEEKNLNHDMVLGKKFLVDLVRIGFDALIGVAISVLLFVYILKLSTLNVILASVVGAILPDPLQFVYWKTRSKVLLPLQKFHKWIHGRTLTIDTSVGILLQVAIILIFLSISLLIR